jgi:hypothetical protein
LWQPRALGVGYDVIGDLLNQHMLVSAALALLLVKAVIWLLALGSGTSGGVLAPLLMMGAGLGLVLAPCCRAARRDCGRWSAWPQCWAACWRAADGHRLCLRPDACGQCLAAAHCHHIRGLWRERAVDEALHHDREDRATRAACASRYGVDPLERVHVDDLMSSPQALEAVLPAGAALALCRRAERVHRYYPVTAHGRLVGMVALSRLQSADPAEGCGTCWSRKAAICCRT